MHDMLFRCHRTELPTGIKERKDPWTVPLTLISI
jgi:hypothetical protein